MKKIINKQNLILISILALGLFLRLYDINWDQNSHLHPDERFLTMVGNRISIPDNIKEYFDPNISGLNPQNVGFDFFVYGLFPITLNKVIALILGNDNYNNFTTQGRIISALFDLLIIVVIFKTVKLLEEKYKLDSSVKYYSASAYAVFVLPIQLAHFFTTDTFLNFFLFSSFFFALSYFFRRAPFYLILSSIFFGLALSSKVSGIFALPVIIPLLINLREFRYKSFVSFFINLTIFSFLSLITAKVASPYMFSGVWSVTPNQDFLNDLATLKNLTSKNSSFPPMIQWFNKLPIIFPLQNIVFLGVGIPVFVAFLIGAVAAIKSKGRFLFIFILLWIIAFFVYQGIQTVTTMRYFIIIYPFIAIFAGIGLAKLIKKSSRLFIPVSLILISFWATLFFSIYTKPHTRIRATQWINENIPEGTTILAEHWDDVLPLNSDPRKNYKILQLPVFDPDTKQKWQQIDRLLAKGDYLILSSNRGWGSIQTVPDKYPRMNKFYKDLFDGKLSYKKIREFTSYPSLEYLGIPVIFSDDWAEESFTVYDHPKVLIFKKNE